jgi:hypothetical protein
LVINEAEPPIVRRIYDMALGRKGSQLGVKAIASTLNAEGVHQRGKPFHFANVYRVLTSPTYVGTHHFNRRDSRTRAAKDRDQWVTSTVPAIIAQDVFDQVQASLAARNSKRIPPSVVSGPMLLTGLARCATCDSGMTIRTGKSGRYRYYVCAGCAQKGKTHCQGRSIGMAALDGMILEHLADEMFTPERLTTIFESYMTRSVEADGVRGKRLAQARARATEIAGTCRACSAWWPTAPWERATRP